MTIGVLLKKYRGNKGIPQKQMAALLGITREYYAKIEEDKVLPALHLQDKIARLTDSFILYAMPYDDPKIQAIVRAVNRVKE